MQIQKTLYSAYFNRLIKFIFFSLYFGKFVFSFYYVISTLNTSPFNFSWKKNVSITMSTFLTYFLIIALSGNPVY